MIFEYYFHDIIFERKRSDFRIVEADLVRFSFERRGRNEMLTLALSI